MRHMSMKTPNMKVLNLRWDCYNAICCSSSSSSSSRGYYLWLSPSIESCNWIDFISVAYASWYHWNCGRTQHKAATINQLACPSYSLYVQLLWYPMYYPGGMKARVSPVQWSKPHSILTPTQDSNPGGRIQNHKRWPLTLPLHTAYVSFTCS